MRPFLKRRTEQFAACIRFTREPYYGGFGAQGEWRCGSHRARGTATRPGLRDGQMAYDLNWELRLGFLVHDVSRLRRSTVDRALKPLGVTRSQWWVLAFLSRADGMSQVALADELDLGKVALGGLIDRLEKTGLVSRRPDEDDRRVKRIYLTRRSHALIAQIRDNVSVTEKEILEKIDEADLKATVRALRGMKENLLTMTGDNEDVEDTDA